MSLRILLVAVLLLLAAPLHAQTRIALPPPLISSPGADQPVELQAATIAVERAGAVAHTTIELTLHNPSARPLEGQLAFPLRDGQQVSGFALDIDGELHDAVPVTKERGREVFEAIERRRVDPALLERTEGNHFRLRVFPVPAGGVRHVRIELIESLRSDGDDWRLQLPLQFAAGLERVPLRVAGNAPTVAAAAGTLRFARVDGGVAADLGPRQLKAAGGLELQWRAVDNDAQTQEYDGDVWFHAEAAIRDRQPRRELPARVGLLWDASGSAATRDTGLEFALLDRYFAAAGDVDVQLQLLRDRAAPVQRFRVRDGDWSELQRALRAVVYDGATDLGSWTPEKDVGEYLLLSDGLANYGSGIFPALAAGQRLFAISSSGAAADSARLHALAEARGGWLVELQGGAAGLEAAVARLLAERVRIVAIDAIGATDVVAASPFVEDGRLRVGGRLTAAAAEITLHVATGNGRPERLKVRVEQGEPGQGRFLAQVVAGHRLRQLQADPVGNRTAIRALGQRFGLVTAETSLLVLESLDDYVRYDIVPPESMRAAFHAQRLAGQQSRDDARRQNLDLVASAFAERRQWWETDFSGRGPPVGIAKVASEIAEAAIEALTSPASPVPAPPAEPTVVFDEPSPVDIQAPPPVAATRANAQDTDGRRERRAADAPATSGIAAPADDATVIDSVAVTGGAVAAPEGEAAAATADGNVEGGDNAVIALQAWAPDSDVARRLRAAPADQVYVLYLDERAANADSPAFLLDVADILLERGQRDLALRVLSNLAEMQLENRALLRVLGYRLMQADAAALAVPVFARVRELADEEPQSHRDYGLALDAAGQPQQAVDALYEVVARPWDSRFGGIALIALGELNAIAAREGDLDTSSFDPRLLQNLPLALRAVLTWDADATDMDLWVTQPDGEQVSYNSHNSVAGGRLSEDFTGGYGPEEYAIRRSRDGVYRIEVDHYGSSTQLVTGAVTVQVWLSTGFGTPAQRDQRLTVRLEEGADRLLVGEFSVD